MALRAVDAGELASWIWLVHRVGVGRATLRRLLARFGSPAALADLASANAPELLAQLSERRGEALLAEPPGHAERVETTLAWLRADARRCVLTLGDADYPQALLESPDPPLLLFAEGRLECLGLPALAMVGSRRPTAQGLENARRFAGELASGGWCVVSGLAAGIDGAAHAGALGAEGGATIAVVGTGLDRVYPAAHRALATRIAAHGLLLSEYPLGTPPAAEHFPQRNRIIAGLARGTLVVEAALRSGSLITARLASEAGREVFAVPGSIHAAQSRGCHALLREGATLVESVEDILAEVSPPELPARMSRVATSLATASGPTGMQGAAPPGPSADEEGPRGQDPVLQALGHEPATLDTLIARCGWPAPALSVRLLELELAGHVARLPGGLYQRIGQA